MPYRKISIGTYFNVAIAVVFAAAAVILTHQVKSHVRQQAIAEARIKAQLILDRNLATHTYFSHTLKPRVFEFTDPIRSKDYFDPSWMSSTYAVREIDVNFKALNGGGYYYKECAINARSPENEADAFERRFIEELNADPKLTYRSLVRQIDGADYYVVLRRGEVMEESCLRCHSQPDNAPQGLVDIYGQKRSFHRSPNEVISAISIRIPLSDAYKNAQLLEKNISRILIVALLSIFLVQYLLYRLLIVEPMEKMNKKAIEISNNEELIGDTIPLPITKEFCEFATSFNKMSGKLHYHFAKLEETVATRTQELSRSNEELTKALEEIRLLKGILPVCSYCKSIRDDSGAWDSMESYLAKHTEAEFSHGVCPKCMRSHYPEEYESLRREGKI